MGFKKCFLNLSLNMPCISTNSIQASHFLHIIIICICGLFDNTHSDRCEVTSHFWFDLHFSDYPCWASFHVSVNHLYIVFGAMSSQIFCPFFIQGVCFSDIELYKLFLFYILFVNPLCVILFANIFSYPVVCFFICQWFPLSIKLGLICVCFFLCFCFCCLCLRGQYKKKYFQNLC